jgi:N-succinyl-L-ornithine transcarbamylase
MQHFTSVRDVDDPLGLVREAIALKRQYLEQPDSLTHIGKHKTLGLVFFNPSLRTRLSSEKAAYNLGMTCISLDADRGWNLEFEDGVVMNGNSAEHIREAAAVISQYCDVLGVRSFATLSDRARDYADFVLEKFRQFARVPVISLEGAILHPLQSLADWITMEEVKERENMTHRPKVVLTWAPHPRALPQAVPNSFVEWMREADVDLVVTQPRGYELAPRFTEGVNIEYNQDKAFEGADFIYAKNWSNYNDYGKVLSMDSNWTVTTEKMNRTNNGKFMHCLPVRRNQIVTDAVLDSPNSIVIEEANNRTFSAMAVLKRLLKQ